MSVSIVSAQDIYSALVACSFPPPPRLPDNGRFIHWGKNNKYRIWAVGSGYCFKDFSSDEVYGWFADSGDDKFLSSEEIDAKQKERAKTNALAEIERNKDYAVHALEQQRRWLLADESGFSQYLEEKQVKNHGLRFEGDVLLVPVFDEHEALQSIQEIYPDGTKKFAARCKMKGGRFIIGDIDDAEKILIAEGYATAATLHECLNLPCVVAFNAGNVQEVAKSFSGRHVVICGDNDKAGRDTAKGEVFPSEEFKDFNDLFVAKGLDSVRSCFVLKPEAPDAFPEHLIDAPNLLGEITCWINDCSMYPQPVLALGATACFLGAALGHRVKSPSNVRTNIYAVGICESGEGKDSAIKSIINICRESDCMNLLLGGFASDTSIGDSLHASGGRGLGFNDEFGNHLKSYTAKGANGYESRIPAVLKEIYTKSDTIYHGKQYANRDGKKVERRDVDQPCLSIYGTATPKQFFDALTGDNVIDGFFPRWLVFEGQAVDAKKHAKHGNVPESIIKQVVAINKMPTDTREESVGTILLPGIHPALLRFSREAWQKIEYFETECRARGVEERKKGTGLNAIWNRAAVHAQKLAMIASDFEEVRLKETEWACDVVQYLMQRAVKLASENIADSDYHRLMNEVLQFVRLSPRMERSRREVMRKFQRIEMKKTEDALKHLVESDSLKMEERKNMRGKTTIIFSI